MRYRFKLAAALAVALCGSVSAADWPQWRGPRGTGITDERNLPERWSATENVAWKASLAGLGVSSPIVSGDRVFVTSQIGTGVRRAGNHPRLAQGATRRPRPVSARLRRQARAAGRSHVLRRRSLQSRRRPAACGSTVSRQSGPLPGVHDKHNLASPSPVTDGQMVYAWFGTGQIVALDMSGKVVWERHLGKEISPFEINWGHASSPTLYQDLADSAMRSCAGVVSARGRQAHRQGSVEDRSRPRPIVVHDAVRRRAPPRAGADRQLERARRCVRSEDRRVPVARRRAQSVSHSGADVPRRRRLHEPRLSQRSVHGDSSRWPRRYLRRLTSSGR